MRMNERLDPNVRHGTCLACGNRVELTAYLTKPLTGVAIFVFCGCRPNFAMNIEGPHSMITFFDHRRN